jgi:hypothetical protein
MRLGPLTLQAMIGSSIVLSPGIAWAQTEWAAPVPGYWRKASNWSPANIPDQPAEAARISVPGTYWVTLNTHATIASLDVSNPDVSFDITGQSITLLSGSFRNAGTIRSSMLFSAINGTLENLATGNLIIGSNTYSRITMSSIVNDGSIVLNNPLNPNAVYLDLVAPAALSGTGTLALNGESPSKAVVTLPDDDWLTNGIGHTVRGVGDLPDRIVNMGAIRPTGVGEWIVIGGGRITNHGELGAVDHADLQLSSSVIDQFGDGRIIADNALVRLTGAVVEGGLVTTARGGLIHCGTYINVTNDGLIHALPGGVGIREGTLVNNGLIVVTTNGEFKDSGIVAETSAALAGSGEVLLLSAPPYFASMRAREGAVLTHGPSHTVRGFGRVQGEIINLGLINADEPGGEIIFDGAEVSNAGVIRASPGAALMVSESDIDNGDTGRLVTDDATIRLADAVVIGGSIEAHGGGQVEIVGPTLLDDVRVSAPMRVLPGMTLQVGSHGAVIDTCLRLESDSVAQSRLEFFSTSTITGTGEISSGGSSQPCRIMIAPGATATIGPEIELSGRAVLSGTMEVQGTLAPDGMHGVLTSPGSILRLLPGSRLTVTLNESDAVPAVHGSGFVSLDGAVLHATLDDSGHPPFPFVHAVLTGTSVFGAFSRVGGDPLPYPWAWRARSSFGSVHIAVTCLADLNADLQTDILDLLDFLDAFSACEGAPAPCSHNGVDPDLSQDGLVDVLDFLDYIEAFSNVC